jgi:hypothetical protein
MKILIMMLLFLNILVAEVMLETHTKVLYDPIHGIDYPKRIPNSTIRYYYEIINDSEETLKEVLFKTDLDVGVLDISQSPIMIDKKHLLKSTSLNLNTGEIEIRFLTLPAYEKVRIMIDTVLR